MIMDDGPAEAGYADHVTDGDLRLIAVATGAEDTGAAHWRRDPGTLARLLADPRVTGSGWRRPSGPPDRANSSTRYSRPGSAASSIVFQARQLMTERIYSLAAFSPGS